MTDTSKPLDITFIADKGKITNIEQMMPFSSKSVLFTKPAPCVLELKSGWFEKNGAKAGDSVDGFSNFQKIGHTPENNQLKNSFFSDLSDNSFYYQ